MKLMPTATRATAAGATVIAALALAVVPAHAAGQSVACANGSLLGTNTQAQAVSSESGNCGTMEVRARYTHIGGASWTGWVYHPSYAVSSPGNVVRSHHQGQGGAVGFYLDL